MIRSTTAIAGLAVRSAIRSRFVVCLVLVLLATVIGLPLTIKGDGTLAGRVRVMITYCMGFSGGILAVATLWISCMLISREVTEKQILQVVTKPVHRIQVWLGKWLGLMVLDAILLAAAGILTYGLVRWHVGRTSVPKTQRMEVQNEILVGRRRILPRPEIVDHEIHEEAEALQKTGKTPPNMTMDDVLRALKKRALSSRSAVAPGASKTWIFDLPRSVWRAWETRTDGGLSVRFHLSTYSRDRKRLTGTWHVGTEKTPWMFSYRIEKHLDGVHRFSVPIPMAALGKGPVVVTFENAARGVSNPAVFRLEKNIELLVLESSFEANLGRALLILFCQLALLAALGLAVSAILSFPVATFSAVSVLVMAVLVHYFTYAVQPEVACNVCHHHHGEQTKQPVLVACEKFIWGSSHIIEPVMQFKTLETVSDGVLISWKFTGRAILFLLVIYPLAFGVLGGVALNKRELALPD